MPATTNAPSAKSTSPADASSRWAAISLPLSTILSAARSSARAADGDRARAEGAGAVRNRIGVALDDLDLLDRDAELRRQDLREGGGVALAVIVGAEHGAHGAVGLDANGGRLIEADAGAQRAREPRRRDPRRFDVAGHADAAQSPAPRSGRASLLEMAVVGDLQRAREDFGKIAAIVGRADRGLVRHVARRNEIAPADLGAVEPERPGRAVRQPFQHVAGLGPAGAAISVGRRGVGEHAGHFDDIAGVR